MPVELTESAKKKLPLIKSKSHKSDKPVKEVKVPVQPAGMFRQRLERPRSALDAAKKYTRQR